jgi:ParB family chromosome partitioning protein
MRKLGQLQPIGVDADGVLVFGGRRLMAARSVGWAEIAARVIDCDALQAEHDENEIRKQFTVTERLAIAQRIAERLQGRVGRPGNSGNISCISPDQGQTRDIAAAKAGLGSGKTLEAAQKVVERGVPELVEAMDAGKVSIHAAAELTSLPKEDQRRIDYSDRQQVKRAREQTKQKARIHIVIEYEDAHQGAEDLAATLIKRDAGFAAELRAALNFALGGS